jgi:hypothetical protein
VRAAAAPLAAAVGGRAAAMKLQVRAGASQVPRGAHRPSGGLSRR